MPIPRFKPGTVGLVNLGNTCYMNSALQCLAHIPNLVSYFVSGDYQHEINRYNPLGYDGNIAENFGKLLNCLVGADVRTPSYSCRLFRECVDHYSSTFSSNRQQDSQEFLSFLLDGLHEYLNRVIEKPATEKAELNTNCIKAQDICDLAEKSWSRHLLRNDSVVVDLFTGLYKSTIFCSLCKSTSISFDPFTSLTLPIPKINCLSFDLKVFPKSRKPLFLTVEIESEARISDLRKYVGTHCKVKASCL